MKMLFSGVTALGMIGTVAMVASDQNVAADSYRTAAFSSQELREAPGVGFVMARGESSCAVTKGEALSPDTSQLYLGADCAEVFPALAEARYWRELEDGTVAFAPTEGGAILEFAEADGVAYETFRRGAPLIALVARD